MCQCCGSTKDNEGNNVILGTLAMPMRRLFLICQDCVNYMWHGRSFANQDGENEGNA